MDNTRSFILSFQNDLIGNPFLLKLPKVINFLDSYLHENDKIKIFVKLIILSSVIALLTSCSSSKEFSEFENVPGTLIESGIASWYGPDFHGNKTANGERYNMNDLTAAHRTLSFGSIVKVYNRTNGKSVIVRINDRGPYAKERIIDLSKKAAEKIDLIQEGSAEVELRLLNEDKKLPINLKVPHFTVQVGSYKKKNDALSFSSSIDNSRVIQSKVNEEIYYRVYVGLFTEKTEAENLKESLQEEGIDGFVKQVEN